jgi:ADP-ribose pyrophosphatase YjhB (NUDIX family)
MEKHFTASALIIDKGKVLLVYHKKLGVWLYPGGHVEADENPEEALLREVKEETGLQIEILGEKDENLSDRSADVSVLHMPYAMLCELVGDHYHNDIIYLCCVVGKSDRFVHNPKESDGIGFFGLKDLIDIKLFPNFKRLLEKVLKKNR